MEAYRIWNGSDGAATTEFYNRLKQRGPAGEIAVALFRANKNSARAKVYRGGIRGKGSYRSMAYERKDWSLEQLCIALEQHSGILGIIWGWSLDTSQPIHNQVLYLDIPDIGQVSFHTKTRLRGPEYPGRWDGTRLSTERICRLCEITLT